MLSSTIFLLSVLLLLPTSWSQEEGIRIVKNPDPVTVCEGKPASFTWRYNAANLNFQIIYFKKGTSDIVAELLAGTPATFTAGGNFVGRVENITKVPQAIDGGEVTLTITSTRLSDSGNITIDIADTAGKQTLGAGPLTVRKAPALTAGKTELTLERVIHNMTTTLIHCKDIQDPGSPPVKVTILRSEPGRNSDFHVDVVNGEGKQAFFSQERYGTFKCALSGPAAACSEPPLESPSVGFFTTPGAPRLEPVEARATSAKISFKAGFHGGAEVSFMAKYQEQGAEAWTEAPKTLGHLQEGQPGSLEILDLKPKTNYSVYVIATNPEGSKQSMTESFTTAESDGGLGVGGIIGIVIGVTAGITLCGIGVYCWKKQGKKEKSSLEEMEKMNKAPVPV